MKRKKIIKLVGLISATLVVVSVTLAVIGYHNPKEYDVTVTKIGLDPDNIYNYLIQTQLQSGEEKAFVIDNPGLKETEISEKVYELDEGDKYSLKVIGWEVPILNQHERIIDVKQVS